MSVVPYLTPYVWIQRFCHRSHDLAIRVHRDRLPPRLSRHPTGHVRHPLHQSRHLDSGLRRCLGCARRCARPRPEPHLRWRHTVSQMVCQARITACADVPGLCRRVPPRGVDRRPSEPAGEVTRSHDQELSARQGLSSAQHTRVVVAESSGQLHDVQRRRDGLFVPRLLGLDARGAGSLGGGREEDRGDHGSARNRGSDAVDQADEQREEQNRAGK